MITCSSIAMGDQLGAQLGTLAALMHIGIINNQEVVFWEELKDFRRGFQFLRAFDIDGIEILKRSSTIEQVVIKKYCQSFKKQTWQSQMKRIYDGKIRQLFDRGFYRTIYRHYHDFSVLSNCQNGIRTDEQLCHLQKEKNYDIRNGFGTYSDWGENAKEILGRLHFKQEIQKEGKSILKGLPKEKKVGVHFRKTDYLIMSSLNLNEEYYRKALGYFDSDITCFVVFSDDIEACKEMSLFSNRKTIFMDRHNAMIDLFLMSRMNGNIIANSSFSLWGALLNPNTELVVCPHDYIGKSRPELQYINGNYYPKEWIAI